MPEGDYVAFSGALANQRALDVIANNIANASTTGFQRDNTVFDTELGARLHYAGAEVSRIDPSPGAQRLTGSSIHAAIDGPGFFPIEGPEGEVLYTRRGDFRLNAEGELVLPSGMRVQGDGTLRVPPGSRGELTGSGQLMVDGSPAGRLRIVEFEDMSGLSKAGESLVRAAESAGAAQAENPRLAVGYIETSNVNLAAEMVALITASRAFESAVRAMTIQDELTQSLIQSQGN